MPSEKKHILVIDDDPDVVEVIKVVLESVGYSVESASDGDSGLAKMRARKPALVILDVMMRKETEGFHVSYAIKNDPALAKIPILMLTAIGEKTGMKFAPDKDGEYLPVEAFVEKPIEPNDLIARVGKLIAAR
jgi:CheY-like chemotaxis protein